MKYRPPKLGGGFATTNTLTLSSFMCGQSFESHRAWIKSAAFCATMTVGALVLAEVPVGNTDASTTRSASIPCTRSDESTTEFAAVSPMRQVLTGWYTV